MLVWGSVIIFFDSLRLQVAFTIIDGYLLMRVLFIQCLCPLPSPWQPVDLTLYNFILNVDVKRRRHAKAPFVFEGTEYSFKGGNFCHCVFRLHDSQLSSVAMSML